MIHNSDSESGPNELIPESEPLWEIDASRALRSHTMPPAAISASASSLPELKLAVRAAIAELPAQEQEAINLVLNLLEAGKQLNVAQMAMELGITYSAFYRRVSGALFLLHTRLSSNPLLDSYLEKHKPDIGLEPLRFVATVLSA